MSLTVNINKGLDIRLLGSAEKKKKALYHSKFISISPLDFHGLNPKMMVKEGDAIKAGDPLFLIKQMNPFFLSLLQVELLGP